MPEAESRKQDRNNGLLGWWVSQVLILCSILHGSGLAKVNLALATEGAGALSNGLPAPNSQSKMHWGKDAKNAPFTSTRITPVIDRSKVNPQLLKSAEGMEALFINQMLSVMRQSIPKNDMDLESPATEIYRGMMDSEYAQKAAHHGGIGLADQIIAYLQSQSYDLGRGQGALVKEKP